MRHSTAAGMARRKNFQNDVPQSESFWHEPPPSFLALGIGLVAQSGRISTSVPVLQQYHEDGARIEAAFRHYIHRADPKQKEDSYEIIVCHANVIRYFVCRFVLRVGSSRQLLASLTAMLQLNPCFIFGTLQNPFKNAV